MSEAIIYKENCFSICCNRCSSIRLKLYLQFCLLSLAVLGNKHILLELAWFCITHKYMYTKMCFLLIVYFLVFAFDIFRIRNMFWLQTVRLKISRDLKYKHTCQDKMSRCHAYISSLARPGRWAFISKWWLPMPNFGSLWRLIYWDRMHFRSSNLSE